MSKVSWINHKTCDFDHVQELLKTSLLTNQMTNYGPVVRNLELFLVGRLDISPEYAVIVVTNAALGLDALVGGINWELGKELRYATQAFTFPCAAQGKLNKSQIVDINEVYGPDLDQVDPQVDGLVVTNLFGNVTDIDKYLAWAHENNKILLFDNATVPLTKYNMNNALNLGDGSIVSLHHTKPLGFGEGGIVVVKKKYEKAVRKCINFGFDVLNGKVTWNSYGLNAKMPELSAAVILSYLQKNMDRIYEHQLKMYQIFKKKLENIKGVKLFPSGNPEAPFVSCFALIFDREITNDDVIRYELHNITVKKYYTPLAPLPRSTELFNHVLCLPCHLDITEDTIDRYIDLVSSS